MKKVLFLLLIGGMFAVTACGGGSEKASQETQGTEESTPSEPVEEPTEPVEMDSTDMNDDASSMPEGEEHDHAEGEEGHSH